MSNFRARPMVAYRRDAKFASVKKFVVSEAVAKPTSLFVFEKKSLAHSFGLHKRFWLL